MDSLKHWTQKAGFSPAVWIWAAGIAVGFGQETASEKASIPEPSQEAAIADSPMDLKSLLEDAKAKLKTMPSESPAESVEAEKRSVLQRRISLIEEYQALHKRAQTYSSRLADIDVRVEQAKKEAKRLQNLPSISQPETVTQQQFEQISQSVSQKREEVAQLQTELANVRNRTEKLPELVSQAQSRANEAEEQIAETNEKLVVTADGPRKQLLEWKIRNWRIEKEIAQKQVAVYELEAKLNREMEPLITARLDVAQLELERLDKRLALYRKALEAKLAQEQEEKTATLEEKQKEVVTAESPSDKFLAELEAKIAESKKNRSDLSATLVEWTSEASDQQQRLDAEQSDFNNLRDYVDRPEAASFAAERMKAILKQLRPRRQAIQRQLGSGFTDKLGELRTRRFQILDLLKYGGISERLRPRLEAIIADLPESQKESYRQQAEKLLMEYRETLRKEQEHLGNAIQQGETVHRLLLDRLALLDQTERFIRARAFWLRDARALDAALFRTAWGERARAIEWFKSLFSNEVATRVRKSIRSPLSVFYAILLFPVLPVALFYVRQRLRDLVGRSNEQRLQRGASVGNLAQTLLIGVLSAAVVPVYFLLASRFVLSADLPEEVGPVVAKILATLAYFLFFWFLSRSFFGYQGIAQIQFGLPTKASRALYRALKVVLVGTAIFLFLSRLLGQPPFQMETVARLAYTLFEVTVALALVALLRPKSSFIQETFVRGERHFFARHWKTISPVLVAGVVGIVILDMLGYRYGAQTLGRSFLLSFVTLLIVAAAYHMIVASIETGARRRRRASALTAPGEEGVSQTQVINRVVQFVRVAFILVSVLLLAVYWGIDDQFFKTLDETTIYEVRGEGETAEIVSVADALVFIIVIAATIWLVRYLPGIYEFTIFPRLRLDEGAKYALLTISRYSIVAIGLVIAMGVIHLDLSRLGWLVAALGVGLGFGLQEIVSNFVSGIILLVERPIQVGDVITVGSMSGTVRRINIRATTVLNFDQQEVVLPNRNLITQDVTNWTRGDTVNRLVITIGVGYGSDVDQVSKALERVAASDKAVLKDPAPSVIFTEHGESSLNFAVRVYIPSPDYLMPVRDRLNKAINAELRRLGIEIPFPQRDLHIKSSAVRLGAQTPPGE